jgi:hypothetical protein
MYQCFPMQQGPSFSGMARHRLKVVICESNTPQIRPRARSDARPSFFTLALVLRLNDTEANEFVI